MKFLDLLLGSDSPAGAAGMDGWARCAQARARSVRCELPLAGADPEALRDMRLERLRRLGWATVGGTLAGDADPVVV